MKGLFFTLAIMSFVSSISAETSPSGNAHVLEISNMTPQQIADTVSHAVRENPEKATAIVRQAMRCLDNSDTQFSDSQKKQVTAVISSAVAAAPSANSNSIIAAGAGVIPALGAVISQAASAASSDASSPSTSGPPSGMILGNIRVQKIEGNGVKLVDQNGKTSNLKEGDFLTEGVRVVTGSHGSATLLFENGSLVRVTPESEFSIDKFEQDPFDTTQLDYTNIPSEPSRSTTRTGVIKGEITFDVASLKKSSSYEIVTPVGIAGIRGTGGFARSTPKNQAQAGSFGLFEGSASFTTPSGQSQMVNQNQSIGVSGPAGNFGIIRNPPDGTASLAQASRAMNQARSNTNGKPFSNAPPRVAAPNGPLSSLTPAQQQALEQAASDGAQTVAEVALQLAMESPEFAVDIAAAAADLAPTVAGTIATIFCNTFPEQSTAVSAMVSNVIPTQAATISVLASSAIPSQAAAIAAAIVATVPSQALTIATLTALAVPSQATFIASKIATVIPSQSINIATGLAAILPTQASAIAAAVAGAVPTQAASIASAVTIAVPAEAGDIASAVAAMVPAQATAIAVAVAASAPTESSAIGAAVSAAVPSLSNVILNALQNPAILIPNTPFSSPSPFPSPSPSPSPSPPVSPSA